MSSFLSPSFLLSLPNKRTCHFCGRIPLESTYLQCSNRFCEKTGHGSVLCISCLKRQQVYFQTLSLQTMGKDGLGDLGREGKLEKKEKLQKNGKLEKKEGMEVEKGWFENVFGNVNGVDWFCLDCCCVLELENCQIGICCCSWRRRKIKCPIHVDENSNEGRKLHCHTYRRKGKAADLAELLEIGHLCNAGNLRVPEFVQGRIANQQSRFQIRELAISPQNLKNMLALMKIELTSFSSGIDKLQLQPGKGRRTCHWCGKEAKENKRFVKQTEKIYCANIYCDKVSGNSQLICGNCLQKQKKYFEMLNVDIGNVFGDITNANWFCLDCCFNELGVGEYFLLLFIADWYLLLFIQARQ